MNVKAVIVEDEEASRITLKNYVTKYCSGVEIVGEADGVKNGLEAIKMHKPDLIFLDIEMPYGNAFDLLEQFDDVFFETIFVTAYSNYAVKAINYSACHYLLKPIDIDELVIATQKVISKIQDKKRSQENLNTKILLENIQITNSQLKKIVLPVLDGFEVVEVQEIIRCKANDNFTDFHLIDGKKKVICRTLKFYDQILSELGFVRVHKSHLINMQYVKAYKKGKGGYIEMQDGSMVDVSASKKQAFLDHYKR
ncbi:MAG: response regulator transcription factor [Crocinitomicaceae bacterium]|jgi:two-component system LytT family response regulator|nr:response regulator transcription factor [Crocinitomicaceae bacterium]MBT5402565.1 response regulator transcription factor [Crocinitomicaceae bacterium]MBT6030407.1 response regulator transcription factor [Crocinitomicaceae bacterium]